MAPLDKIRRMRLDHQTDRTRTRSRRLRTIELHRARALRANGRR